VKHKNKIVYAYRFVVSYPNEELRDPAHVFDIAAVNMRSAKKQLLSKIITIYSITRGKRVR
jgi:hypothetical protein